MLFDNCKNTKKQGDIGLGAAIAYFSKIGAVVCLPISDSQDYDLIVELDGELKKVQVKTTGSTNKYSYFVDLRSTGGNSKKNFVLRKGKDIVFDLLFILTEEGTQYIISRDCVKENVSLGVSCDKYKVV
jgi:hypothetical protein